MKKILLVILSVSLFSVAASADVLQDFNGLGENKDLFDTAKALHPDMKVSVVQERIVDRRNRFELAPEAMMISGGENYLNTYGYGANIHYHIVPWISVGARYTYFTNKFTSEAENIINDIDANGQGIIPDIDHPENAYMGFVNFYPIYGKMNSLGLGITHFDIYGTVGYGSMGLKKGNSNIWTAGAGVGFWFSQHLTTRLEVRYQSYEAVRYNDKDTLGAMATSLQIGYLL